MLKRKKILVSAVLVIVLLVAMATTAFADTQTAYIYIGDSTSKYSGSLGSTEAHAHGYSYIDSGINIIFKLQKSYGDYAGTEILPGYSANIPTKYCDPWEYWRVRLYPFGGSPYCHGYGTVYDW